MWTYTWYARGLGLCCVHNQTDFLALLNHTSKLTKVKGHRQGCGGVGIQGGGGDRDRGEDTTERLKGYMGYCSLGRIGNQFSLFK